MPPGRDWLDITTLIIALAALWLGVSNAWASRSRIEIALIGAFAPPSRLDEDLDTNATIEIYNPGTQPVLVTEAGFSFKDGMKHVVGNHDGTGSSEPFPHRLRGRDAFLAWEDALELAIPAIKRANPPTHAWARAAGGRYTHKRLPSSWFDRYAEAAGQRIGSL